MKQPKGSSAPTWTLMLKMLYNFSDETSASSYMRHGAPRQVACASWVFFVSVNGHVMIGGRIKIRVPIGPERGKSSGQTANEVLLIACPSTCHGYRQRHWSTVDCTRVGYVPSFLFSLFFLKLDCFPFQWCCGLSEKEVAGRTPWLTCGVRKVPIGTAHISSSSPKVTRGHHAQASATKFRQHGLKFPTPTANNPTPHPSRRTTTWPAPSPFASSVPARNPASLCAKTSGPSAVATPKPFRAPCRLRTMFIQLNERLHSPKLYAPNCTPSQLSQLPEQEIRRAACNLHTLRPLRARFDCMSEKPRWCSPTPAIPTMHV